MKKYFSSWMVNWWLNRYKNSKCLFPANGASWNKTKWTINWYCIECERTLFKNTSKKAKNYCLKFKQLLFKLIQRRGAEGRIRIHFSVTLLIRGSSLRFNQTPTWHWATSGLHRVSSYPGQRRMRGPGEPLPPSPWWPLLLSLGPPHGEEWAAAGAQGLCHGSPRPGPSLPPSQASCRTGMQSWGWVGV